MNDESMIEEFKIEAAEMFENAEVGLLNIDKGLDFSSNFNSIFRSFHSLKGAAGMFGMLELQAHMHKLESLFEAQKQHGSIKKHQIDYFLKGVDAGRVLIEGGVSDFVHVDLEAFANEQEGSVADLSTASEISSDLQTKNPMSLNRNSGVVFIVDDEPDIVEILSKILENENYTLYTFENGEDALNSFEKLKPDVILSDISMPKFNGLQMIKAIYEINPSVPVVFISGNISKEKMQEALQYGAYAFIDKPFNQMAILNTCKNALRKSQAMQLLEKSINYILYQFSDLDEYLKSQGKENVRLTLKVELQTILEQRKILKEISKI